MVSFHTIFPSEGASLSSYLGSALRNTMGEVCESRLRQKYLAIFLRLRWEISRSAERDQGAAFGNRKPFEKGLTENFYAVFLTYPPNIANFL